MAVTTRPKKAAPTAKAPTDAKVQVTVTMTPAMIKRIDTLANRRGLSRSAIITLGTAEHLEKNS